MILSTRGHTLYGLSLAMVLLAGCGKSDDDKNAPPPTTEGDKKEKAFALTSGDYLISELQNLQDGCGKKPLLATRPITSTVFILANDGAGNVTIDMCAGQQTGVKGSIKGNKGTLSVLHSRAYRAGDYDQECQVDLTVTGDNAADAKYTEKQTNRNSDLKLDTGVAADECATSFDFKLRKKA